MLHLFAAVVAVSTAALIFAGGLVTSTGSGLSVPDWPNTYGWFMFTFPLEKMVGGIRYEHTHRLIASTVGFLMIVLALWLWRSEPRRWVRRLGYIALAAVITQGILGGVTVLWYLPDPISIAHASLAQLVFCLTVAMTVFTSSGWKNGYARNGPSTAVGTPDARSVSEQRQHAPSRPAPPARTQPIQSMIARVARLPGARPALLGRAPSVLQKMAAITTGWIYLQIVIGATMRHTDAGLAIPDFPLAFGHLIPPQWDAKIAVHFAHRVGALVASVLVVATTSHVVHYYRHRRELLRPSILLLLLLAAQMTLGALTILSAKHYIINSLHVVTGASVLVTSLVLTLRAHRARFADSWGPASAGPPETPSVEHAPAASPRRATAPPHGVGTGARA